MSKHFRPWKIDEAHLLPPSVHDYVPAGHLSRLIVALVRESLDLCAITGSYAGNHNSRKGARLANTRQRPSGWRAPWASHRCHLMDKCPLGVKRRGRPEGAAQAEAVVGSIILPIIVILVAGKPLSSACLRIRASSLAR